TDLTDDFGYVFLYDDPSTTVGSTIQRYKFGTDSDAHQLNGNVMLQYDARFENIDSSTLAGVEYLDSSTDATTFYDLASPIDVRNPVFTGVAASVAPYLVEKDEATTKSLFLQQNLSFYERFIVTAGVRRDFMDLSAKGNNLYSGPFDDSDNISKTSYRSALTYIVSDEVSTYVSYVESVSPPEVGVEPETGKQYEVGAKYSPTALKNALFSAAIYDLTQQNVATAVLLDSGLIEQQTVGESRARGLDLEAKAELTENISLVGGYSYLDAEVTKGAISKGGAAISIKGNDLATAPKHSASLWTYYDVPGTDVSVGLGARYLGSYYYTTENTGKTDGTTLFDAALNYKIYKGTDLALNVSNIADEQHLVGSGTSDYYNPGREVTAKLSYSW
ncbi:MAG: TonB-dependent receptor, partial [Pseudomonas sp.]